MVEIARAIILAAELNEQSLGDPVVRH
jgi:hypothetical protein